MWVVISVSNFDSLSRRRSLEGECVQLHKSDSFWEIQSSSLSMLRLIVLKEYCWYNF
jgi:hypothetical protein